MALILMKNPTKIFIPFFPTDSSYKISELGLSICKEFIEIHDGTREVINNNGLTIKIHITNV